MVCLERQILTPTIVLIVFSAWLVANVAPTPLPRRTSAAVINLHVSVSPRVDPATVTLAKTIATELLESSGIEAQWPEDGVSGSGNGFGLTWVDVQLLPHRKATQPDVSGEVAHDGRTRAPAILVYMPRIADLVRAMQTSTAGRSHPGLATIELGHLAGLTIAHEVGHVLGLPHAPSGVMKARPGMDEVLRLRASQLRFLPPDAARMRQTMVAFAATDSTRP